MHSDFIFENLNPEQRQAVESLAGPLLILAGAGSGKTRVLTHRFANLIAQGLTAPENIWAVTFTNKAAKEMQFRVSKILENLGISLNEDLWISTFHSSCARILRNHIELLGYKRNFVIYDSSDQLSQIKKVLNLLGVNEKNYPAKSFQNKISNAKMQALKPSDIPNLQIKIMDQRSLDVYAKYEEENFKANVLDFDDLLLKTLHLFNQFPKVLQAYQERFQYIMIDEYQDTNHVQYKLVHLLARKHKNLCVVGDEDQSIYSWRGADIQNILNFEQDFPQSSLVKLEQNYRSSKTIVEAATSVIQNNKERKNKTLFTDNPAGELIQVREENDEYSEAKFVVQAVQNILQDPNYSAKDIAIFYRTNAQSRVIEEQLRTRGVHYKIVGGLRFYDRMEIKDVLCYLRLLINSADNIAFKRVINTPTRGIGKTTVQKLEVFAQEANISLMAACDQALAAKQFNAGTSKKLATFLQLMQSLQSAAEDLRPSEIYHLVLEQTGYLQKLQIEDTSEAHSRIENLEEFDSAIKSFEEERSEEATLDNFLEEMALVSDADQIHPEEETVLLMTLHISKGLEFPFVFIVGMEEGIFPSTPSVESADPSDIEEERRIAYVGMTRAMEQLCIVHAKGRRIWGTQHYNSPSRFIEEIPNKYKNHSSSLGGFRSKYGAQQSKPKYQLNSEGDFVIDDIPEYEDFSENGLGIQKGNRVRHPAFGVGKVQDINGFGEEARISVLFSDQRIKTFIAKFARLERLS